MILLLQMSGQGKPLIEPVASRGRARGLEVHGTELFRSRVIMGRLGGRCVWNSRCEGNCRDEQNSGDLKTHSALRSWDTPPTYWIAHIHCAWCKNKYQQKRPKRLCTRLPTPVPRR